MILRKRESLFCSMHIVQGLDIARGGGITIKFRAGGSTKALCDVKAAYADSPGRNTPGARFVFCLPRGCWFRSRPATLSSTPYTLVALAEAPRSRTHRAPRSRA